MIHEKSGENNNSKIGLSYRSYLKNRQIGINIDYDKINHQDTKTDYYSFEYSKGGSWFRISDDTIDPYTTEDIEKYKDRKKRNPISYFSYKSRGRLLELVSKLDKSVCNPKSVLFITLTSPSVGWRDVSGEKWKSRLNNFNTQLRQTFGSNSLFCGIWRLEFQKRGSPHFHLITYNVPFIDHKWVSSKWNKICSVGLSFKEKMKHLQSGTQVEIAKEWGSVDDYFSKTMSYVCKDEGWKNIPLLPNGKPDQHLIEWMKTFGRHWGYICKSNLDKMTHLTFGVFKTKEQYYKVRRWIRKYIQSSRRRKLGNNYNKAIGKKLDNIFKNKKHSKQKVHIPDVIVERMLILVGLEIPPSNTHQSVNKDEEIKEMLIKQVLSNLLLVTYQFCK